MIEQVDIAIVTFVNGFAGQSVVFDKLLLEIFHMSTFKMLPIVTLMVWLWFDEDAQLAERRRTLFCSMVGGFCALVLSRAIQNLGPHRSRPAADERFDFILPEGAFAKDWSSFPSDTSALAFALATGVWLASRRVGLIALLWATVAISFPRLYGGFHYLSDLVAGAMIGMVCTVGISRFHPVANGLFRQVSQLSSRHPAWFYAIFFFVTFQTSTYFIDFREAGSTALRSVGVR